MRKGILFRLAYPYGKPQAYLPSDLLLLSSRLREQGIEARVHDLNLHPMPDEGELAAQDWFGVGVFGAPYLPGAQALSRTLAASGRTVLVGGQSVEHLSQDEFSKIFGDRATRVAQESDLERALGIAALAPLSGATLATALERLPKDDARRYLQGEGSFYLSQGCKFKCDFCAALKGRKEAYRSDDAVQQDIAALSDAAKAAGMGELRMYLSSLDLFQSPAQLETALSRFADRPLTRGVRYVLRGLSRIDSFLSALDTRPGLAGLVQEAGVRTIGFGVDGTTEKVWRGQHKGQKSLSEADRAFEYCERLGITPEILMVMGFPQDTPASLLKNVAYTVSRAARYGAVSRPYLAKPSVPGNAGWHAPGAQALREELLARPELFLNLDFAAFGSPLTHPGFARRLAANAAYGGIVLALEPFGRNATYPLMPLRAGEGFLSRMYNRLAHAWNAAMPFDK